MRLEKKEEKLENLAVKDDEGQVFREREKKMEMRNKEENLSLLMTMWREKRWIGDNNLLVLSSLTSSLDRSWQPEERKHTYTSSRQRDTFLVNSKASPHLTLHCFEVV